MSADQPTRTFTLSEARALVPRLRKLLARALSERQMLIAMGPELDKARKNADNGGGTPLGPSYLRHLSLFINTIRDVHALGVVVKDFQTGLTDFPYEYDGRIVYLCWKPDEDEIEWWHEVDSGFAGRHPLDEDFE
jgi:hypothetical protein